MSYNREKLKPKLAGLEKLRREWRGHCTMPMRVADYDALLQCAVAAELETRKHQEFCDCTLCLALGDLAEVER